MTRIFKKRIDTMNQVASWILLFLFVNVSWIFFRASSISDAIALIKVLGSCDFGAISSGMVSAFMTPELNMLVELLFNEKEMISRVLLVAGLAGSILGTLIMKNTTDKMEEFQPTRWRMFVTATLLVWSIISFSGVTSFIYVNF